MLEELYVKLKFPDYYGYNWNSVDELLRDFWWISEKNIIIVHDISILNLEHQALFTYIDVLLYAINDWKCGDQHKLDVIFLKSDEKIITSIIDKKKI